jgi:site-specific DNA-adenine methylase
MSALLEELKHTNEDFEWYPTTDAMIDAVAQHIANMSSILDIGAGDGRVLLRLAGERAEYVELYAIEKAAPHIENMPANIAIVGTDFEHDTLIDKPVDVIFCNPPYSRFENWATKIIKEGLANDLFLVLPRRWKESGLITAALESRQATGHAIWSGDFSQADRQSRAVVDVVQVILRDTSHYHGRGRAEPKTDPFEVWFAEQFPEVERIDALSDEPEEPERHINPELLAGYNLVDRLVELYDQELAAMHASYRALCKIDPGLLRAVGVKAAEIKAGLRQKYANLKNLYWQELFDHLNKITSRLTSSSRDLIVNKMASSVHVDFTVDNAYAVVLWVLKNANAYIENQLVDLFRKFTAAKNMHNYKSNKTTWAEDHWRFRQQEKTHYSLDYRIVVDGYNAIYNRDYGDYEYPGNLHRDCHKLLGDIRTIANNLNFPCSFPLYSQHREWVAGGAELFSMDDGRTLMRVRAFKNGNMHFQFDQDFIKALNIEASRLLGWIRSPREACDEMGVDWATAEQCFGSNRIFAKSEYKLLCA